MQIVIAHRDSNISKQLNDKLEAIGLKDLHVFGNGFDTLTHIVRNYSKVIIIQEHLHYLNANDIINAVFFKGIKTKFIIIHTNDEIPNINDVTSQVDFINIDKEDSIKKLVAILKTEQNLLDVVN